MKPIYLQVNKITKKYFALTTSSLPKSLNGYLSFEHDRGDFVYYDENRQFDDSDHIPQILNELALLPLP